MRPPDDDNAEFSDEPGGESGSSGLPRDPPLPWRTEPQYVYDAAAERTRERIRLGRVSVIGSGLRAPGIEVGPQSL